VRIIGMSNLETVDIDDEKRSYRRGSYKNRLIVVLAGVTVNALIAFLLFWAYFAAQGTNELTPQISRVVKGSAAAEAGFENGDKFVAIDGEPINTWDDFREGVESHPRDTLVFTVIRDRERLDIEATPRRRDGKGFLGIAPSTRHHDVSFFGAVPESVDHMGYIVAGTANALADLFSPSGISEYSKNFTDAPEEGSRADLERPRSLIGIVDYGSDIINGDLWALVLLLGSISLILALFNTLPLLPFDGGHAAVVLYEWVASKVTRREVRVDFRRLMPVTAIVLAVFLTLGLSAMFLDIRDAVGS
jgi:membrane-associated protease RseP (regulator of RpoE activity)